VWVDQNRRLTAAMIAAVGEQGGNATTVADVIARAGVSRKTFYEHFRNKQDCLLKTADQVIGTSIRQVERAYNETEGWPDRVDAALRALFRLANENPGAVRLSMVEVGAAGKEGLERRERWFAEFERFIAEALKLAPQPAAPSQLVLKAMVGGVCGVLCRRMLPHGRRMRLVPLIGDLVTWITAYHPAPAQIVSQPLAPRPELRWHDQLGGRAPGSLAPHPRLIRRRGLPRGEHNVSRSFVVHNQRERILDAVANLTAAKGYAAVNVEDIVEEAAISLNAFYEHFENKDDAFLVAYEVGHAKCLAIVQEAYAAQSDWRASIHSGISTLLRFLASEPSFARIALVDVLTATPRTAERSNVGVNTFAQMLMPALEDGAASERLAPVTVDAIAGGIFELCLHYAVQDRIEELPELAPVASYFALAPFIGGEEAASIAATRA
jgi:AcrR family transcriptional regulator